MVAQVSLSACGIDQLLAMSATLCRERASQESGTPTQMPKTRNAVQQQLSAKAFKTSLLLNSY
jgi:hypothetical protein